MMLHNIEKTIGYFLLGLGLLLILVPLYQTYAIFTGSAMPAQVFKTQTIEPPVGATNPFDIQAQMQKALANMLPLELIHNTLNLATWLMLMWILMFGGGQIANLGIKLIRINNNGAGD